MELRESVRDRLIWTLAMASWLGAFGLTFAVVSGWFERSVGTVVVLLIGVGVAASLALSRRRLSATIAAVFVTGLKSATSLKQATEIRLRDVHCPVYTLEDGSRLPAPVCRDCAQAYPCNSIMILDGGELAHLTQDQITDRSQEPSVVPPQSQAHIDRT